MREFTFYVSRFTDLTSLSHQIQKSQKDYPGQGQGRGNRKGKEATNKKEEKHLVNYRTIISGICQAQFSQNSTVWLTPSQPGFCVLKSN